MRIARVPNLAKTLARPNLVSRIPSSKSVQAINPMGDTFTIGIASPIVKLRKQPVETGIYPEFAKIDYYENPVLGSRTPMLPPQSGWRYPSKILKQLGKNIVNPQTTYGLGKQWDAVSLAKRAASKSRWEPFYNIPFVGSIPADIVNSRSKDFMPVTREKHGSLDYQNLPEPLKDAAEGGYLDWEYIDRPLEGVDDTPPFGKYMKNLNKSMYEIEQAQEEALGRSLEAGDVLIRPKETYQYSWRPTGKTWIDTASPNDLEQSIDFPKNLSSSQSISLGDIYRQDLGERAPFEYQYYTGGIPTYSPQGFVSGIKETPQAYPDAATPAISSFNTSPPQRIFQSERNIERLPIFPEAQSRTVAVNEYGFPSPSGDPQELSFAEPNDPRFLAAAQIDRDARKILAANAIKQQPRATNYQILPTADIQGYQRDVEYRPMLVEPAPIPGAYEYREDLVADNVSEYLRQKEIEGVIPSGRQVRREMEDSVWQDFIPSQNPEELQQQLSRLYVDVGGKRVPYTGEAALLVGTNAERVRDPSILPDAVDAQQQFNRDTGVLKSKVFGGSPTFQGDMANEAKKLFLQRVEQQKRLQETLDAIQIIDPEKNIVRERVHTRIKPSSLEQKQKLINTANEFGVEVLDDQGDLVVEGVLPVEDHVKLAQAIRAYVNPRNKSTDEVIGDPEFIALREQGQQRRRQRNNQWEAIRAAADERDAIAHLNRRATANVVKPATQPVPVTQSQQDAPVLSQRDRINAAIAALKNRQQSPTPIQQSPTPIQQSPTPTPVVAEEIVHAPSRSVSYLPPSRSIGADEFYRQYSSPNVTQEKELVWRLATAGKQKYNSPSDPWEQVSTPTGSQPRQKQVFQYDSEIQEPIKRFSDVDWKRVGAGAAAIGLIGVESSRRAAMREQQQREELAQQQARANINAYWMY